MLTDAQLNQLDEIDRSTGLHVLMVTASRFLIADNDNHRISRDEYTSHADAALALINGTYTKAAQRIETCVQHGVKNKVQWARKTQGKVNVMNGSSL
jgi:hypothetical protein